MDITEFKKIFLDHDPCEEGRDALMGCLSKVDVYDLAASPKAYDFLMNSVYEGWGPSAKDLKTVFRAFVNGRRTAQFSTPERKVGVQMWCGSREIEVGDEVRWVLLFGCVGRFIVHEWQAVKIIVDCTSDIQIESANNSIVFVENYGGTVIDAKGNCRIKNVYERR